MTTVLSEAVSPLTTSITETWVIAIDCFSGWRRHAAARQRNASEVVTGLA